MKMLLIVAVLSVVGLVVAHFALAARFAAGTDAAIRRLIAAQTSAPPDQATIPSLTLAFAARNGGQPGGPATMTITQKAEMKLAPGQDWLPIAATQISGTRDLGFVWQARGRMAAIIPVVVVDGYVADEGCLEARLAGSVPVANARGADVSRGEAMRFLAELAWNPDAIVNAAGLAWRQVDERTVEVALQTEGGPARVRLGFDADGDVVSMEADDRPRAVGDQNIATRWIGRFSGYARFGNYRLPRFGEVAWVLPEGDFVYWRGEILTAEPARR